MNAKEGKTPDYIKFPYDVFLMLRLEFLALCQDELEAKIMRIIEKSVSEEWERTYRERCARTPKNQEVQMPEEIWVAIPIRYFMDRLLGTVQSETTLKDALKSLINTKKFVFRKDRSGKYEAPLYALNREVIIKFFETLPSDPRKLDILNLMKQPRKKKAVSGDQLLTPSNNDPIETNRNNSRYHQLLTPSTPIIDPMGELAGDQLLTPTNMYYLDDNLNDKNTHVAAIAEHDPLLALLEKFRNGDTQEQQEILQVLREAGFFENDSHSQSTSSNQFPTNDVENPPTSVEPANSTTPSEPSLLPANNVLTAPLSLNVNDSTPMSENASQVAKTQASGDVRIAATSTKPARNTRKTEKSAEPKPAKPAEPKKNTHHPDLGKWYGMFNETCRELGKAEGIPANFTIPARVQYTEAFESLIEAGVTLEQGKWVLTSIWKDSDPFWKKRRTPTAMASQYAVRISRMPRNLHIVPTPERPDPATCEPIDPEKPVERWTRILDQSDVLDLSLEDRKDYFIWKNAQRKVS